MAEPTEHFDSALVDLLDRVLDRGLVVYADVIISLAGVPLLGINLRAALAGMETMVQHGVMAEWDQRLRARYKEAARTFAGPAATIPSLAGLPQPGERAGDDASYRH